MPVTEWWIAKGARGWPFFAALVALLVVLPACRHEIVINASNGGENAEPATSGKPAKVTFSVTVSATSAQDVPLLIEMMRDVNSGVGRDVMFLADPLAAPTSEFDWSTADSELESGICKGEPGTGTPATIKLTFSSNYATAHLADLGHLESKPFFAAFAHCLGHGLGLAHTTNPSDVMQPDFTQTKNFAAFWAPLR